MTSSLAAFQQSQPIATRIFQQSLRQKRLSHGLICHGQSVSRMYQLLMAVYADLACEQQAGTERKACGGCRSCRWIQDNAHPGFITLSRLNYFVDDDGRELSLEAAEKLMKTPPTKIRTGQIRHLVHRMGMSSDYPRMVVFLDAEVQPESAVSAASSAVIPPYDWQSLANPNGWVWEPKGLKRHLFSPAAANRFLKTLEEPASPDTHFVFLAQQPDDLLETVQSRCQLIPFWPEPVAYAFPDVFHHFWSDWLNAATPTPYPTLQRFNQEVIVSTGWTVPQVIEKAMAWCATQTGALNSHQQFQNFQRRLQQLWLCHQQLAAKVSPNACLFELFS